VFVLADELAIVSIIIAISAFLFAIRDHIEKMFSTRQSIYEKYSEKIHIIEQEFKQFATKKFLEFAQTINFPEDEISAEWIQKEYPQIRDQIEELYQIAEGTTTPRDYLSILQRNRENLSQRVLKWIVYFVGLLVIFYIITLNVNFTYGSEPDQILRVSNLLIVVLIFYLFYAAIMIEETIREYRKAKRSHRAIEKLVETYDFKKDELPKLIIEFSEIFSEYFE